MNDRTWQQVWAIVLGAIGMCFVAPTSARAQNDNNAPVQQPADNQGDAAPAASEAKVISLGSDASSTSVSNDSSPAAEESARQNDRSTPEEVETVELFEPGESQSASREEANVEVGSLGEVDMAVKDLEITKALQVLSIQSRKNIIASRQVSGRVTANLYGVGFYEALDAILHPNGFGYEERGNMIYVLTQEELKKRREANRKTVHKMITLDYITASEASTFATPLLSDEIGEIAVSGDVQPGVQPSIGDAGANSSAYQGRLVVFDYEENVNEIVDLIHDLDTKPKQVLIEATILQVRLTEDNALGVDFAAFSDLQVDNFTSPLNAADDLIAGEGAAGNDLNSGNAISTSAGNVANGESGVKVGFLGSDAALFLRALDSVNDTNVLATPKILALNRQKAEIDVGDKLGYLSTTVTDTSQTQTVEFLDVGTQLTLRPFISSDGHVRMELRPTVSDGNTDRVVDGNVIPRETSQTLTTNVMVPNGQTIVLGGLFTEDTSTTTNQIPGLGDVPVVGWLGKGQDDSIRRSEVLFMVKPTIMEDTPLAKMGENMKDEAMRSIPGARKGLLPWSQTKLTAHYMKQAHLALEDGDEDKALWNANLALHVDPTLVDARRIERELTGEELFYHNQSMMDRAVDQVIDSEVGDMDDLESDAGRSQSGMNAEDSQAKAQAADSPEPTDPAVTDSTVDGPAMNRPPTQSQATETRASETEAPQPPKTEQTAESTSSEPAEPSPQMSARAEPQSDSVPSDDSASGQSVARGESVPDTESATQDHSTESKTSPEMASAQSQASTDEAKGDDPAFEMEIVDEAQDEQTDTDSESHAVAIGGTDSARIAYQVWSTVPWFATWQPPAVQSDDPVNFEFSEVDPNQVGR